jgi:glutamate racemase
VHDVANNVVSDFVPGEVLGATGPIGIFDSGFGGLTVARAIVDQLPNEDLIYFGDTQHAPYGTKKIADVRRYALACLDHLVDLGVKSLVIACNTASSVAMADARQRYDLPVIDVILPAARRAVRVSRTGQIGLVCTEATATAGAYNDAIGMVPGCRLTTSPCPRFVDFVEQGITGGDELLSVAHDYLEPIRQANVDTLILGCTHYPLLAGVISYVLGDNVTLVSSADECANQTYATVSRTALINPNPATGHHRFLTTGNADRFAHIGARLMGDFLSTVEHVEMD